MAKSPKFDYIKRAEIARKAGLYRGPAKKLSKSNKSQLTKIFNAVPTLANYKVNNYKSVAVPKEARDEFKKRGFKVVGERVLINMSGATRVTYSNKYKAITAVAPNGQIMRVNRYSLDLDMERFFATTEYNDSYIAMSNGGEGSIGKIVRQSDAENYRDQLVSRFEKYPDAGFKPPVIVETFRQQPDRYKTAKRKYLVPKSWKI
jgi:hypothetical protein